jgi:uncharacterized protein YjiS (DUF1127 family)
MKHALQRALENRRAEAQLESLSDYLLKDIGIRRGDIQRFVRGGPSRLDRHSEDAPC